MEWDTRKFHQTGLWISLEVAALLLIDSSASGQLQPGPVYLANLKCPRHAPPESGAVSGGAISVCFRSDQLQLQIAPNGCSNQQIE
jgi:hypothetical protein